MMRPRLPRWVWVLSLLVLPLIGANDAFGGDLLVESTIQFSALDGSPNDEDGVADGVLTLSSLTVTGSGEIVLDVPVAEIRVAGDVRLSGNGAILTDSSTPPAIGPTVSIISARSGQSASSTEQPHNT